MNSEAFFNQKDIVKVDGILINELKKKARMNACGKYRFCLQHSSQDSLHEMFIVRCKDDYMRPDKHLYTTESHMIIDGAMMVILFEDDGEIRDVFELSSNGYQSYRIDTNIYHMQIPLTEQVVYYEVKLGPFTDKSNNFPEWAPASHDTEMVKKFMKEIKEKIRMFQMSG